MAELWTCERFHSTKRNSHPPLKFKDDEKNKIQSAGSKNVSDFLFAGYLITAFILDYKSWISRDIRILLCGDRGSSESVNHFIWIDGIPEWYFRKEKERKLCTSSVAQCSCCFNLPRFILWISFKSLRSFNLLNL